MKKLLIFSLLLVTALLTVYFFFFQKRLIVPIKSFKSVNFNTIGQNTLVIFDVDETLIQPQDASLIHEHTPQGFAFKKSLAEKYPDISTEEWTYLSSIMLKEAKRPLIEPEIITEIEHLLARNVMVIACTSMNTGPYGIYDSLEQWRYEHLKSLGFKSSFDNVVIKIDSFKNNPVFYRGILYTDLETKGPVIGALLDILQLHPKKIIMFDDSKDYLLSTYEECKKRGIDFYGYLYQGAHEKAWEEDLIQFQAEYLIKNKTWLSDEEARNEMRKILRVKMDYLF